MVAQKAGRDARDFSHVVHYLLYLPNIIIRRLLLEINCPYGCNNDNH
jgi:hypothetical protein